MSGSQDVDVHHVPSVIIDAGVEREDVDLHPIPIMVDVNAEGKLGVGVVNGTIIFPRFPKNNICYLDNVADSSPNKAALDPYVKSIIGRSRLESVWTRVVRLDDIFIHDADHFLSVAKSLSGKRVLLTLVAFGSRSGRKLLKNRHFGSMLD